MDEVTSDSSQLTTPLVSSQDRGSFEIENSEATEEQSQTTTVVEFRIPQTSTAAGSSATSDAHAVTERRSSSVDSPIYISPHLDAQGDPCSFDHPEDALCRICFEGASLENGPLIAPCQCNGSLKYVHVECLELWRRSGQNNGAAAYACPQCHYKYRFKVNYCSMQALRPLLHAIAAVFGIAAVLSLAFLLPMLMG